VFSYRSKYSQQTFPHVTRITLNTQHSRLHKKQECANSVLLMVQIVSNEHKIKNLPFQIFLAGMGLGLIFDSRLHKKQECAVSNEHNAGIMFIRNYFNHQYY
jgi:hypothetical protein